MKEELRPFVKNNAITIIGETLSNPYHWFDTSFMNYDMPFGVDDTTENNFLDVSEIEKEHVISFILYHAYTFSDSANYFSKNGLGLLLAEYFEGVDDIDYITLVLTPIINIFKANKVEVRY